MVVSPCPASGGTGENMILSFLTELAIRGRGEEITSEERRDRFFWGEGLLLVFLVYYIIC